MVEHGSKSGWLRKQALLAWVWNPAGPGHAVHVWPCTPEALAPGTCCPACCCCCRCCCRPAGPAWQSQPARLQVRAGAACLCSRAVGHHISDTTAAKVLPVCQEGTEDEEADPEAEAGGPDAFANKMRSAALARAQAHGDAQVPGPACAVSQSVLPCASQACLHCVYVLR